MSLVAAEVPAINRHLLPGFYGDSIEPVSSKEDFYFSIAVSSHYNFQNETAEAFLRYGSIHLEYEIIDESMLTEHGDMEMEPCQSYGSFHSHYSSSVDKKINSHIDA